MWACYYLKYQNNQRCESRLEYSHRRPVHEEWLRRIFNKIKSKQLAEQQTSHQMKLT